ncbi:MAG: UMP kinase [Pseudomonadales bacterium]|nr:UMP kinase [Pseudomonadales bacterium]
MVAEVEARYRRVLLKLSGEELSGEAGSGIDAAVLERTAAEIAQLLAIGVQVGLVVGGGNLFRGAALQAAGMDRITGDQMGMLATLMNALALRDALERKGLPAELMSALAVAGIAEPYDRRRAVAYLAAGRVVLFAAGTGNPLFTTDSAACLRAVEVGAEVVLKATKVDGVYSADPLIHRDAELYARLTYDQVLDGKLGVMDLAAICLCRDHGIPIRVFRMAKSGALLNIALGGSEGTLVGGD